jgi:hypothetical protein
MARLYSNENFPLPVVEELRRLGHEVLTTSVALTQISRSRLIESTMQLDRSHSFRVN